MYYLTQLYADIGQIHNTVKQFEIIAKSYIEHKMVKYLLIKKDNKTYDYLMPVE